MNLKTITTRSGLPALLLAALILTGVACAKPQVATPEQIESAATKGDTVALANLAEKQCGPVAEATRQTCFEDFFVTLARSDRVHLALGALTSLAVDRPEIARDGHGYTHVIGIRAWKPGADVAAVFRSCTGLFQSGCYHGVIQSYMTQGGSVDSVRAVNLCEQVAPKSEDRWLRFQCVHGLGHGFEMGFNWDLLKSLKGCDWLASGWDRNSCYGGAFMENAVASMPGGHHTSVHALESTTPKDTTMAGMDMGKMADMPAGHSHTPDPTKITFKMRDSLDALYPCSIVDSTYHFACFQLQGGLILTRTKGDFAQATKECDKAAALDREQCYLSLGTNASGMTIQNTSKSIAYCSHGDPLYQPFCFSGAVKNYIDVTSKPIDGIKFCREVPAGHSKEFCYQSVGEEIAVLFSADMAARERECKPAGAEGEASCRMGAQLK